MCPNCWRPCGMLVIDDWLLPKSFSSPRHCVLRRRRDLEDWKGLLSCHVKQRRWFSASVISDCGEEYSLRTWSIVSVLQARKMYQQATEVLPFAATLWKDVKSFYIFCFSFMLLFFFSKFGFIFTRDILMILFQFHSFWCSNSLRMVMAQPSRK